MLHNQYCNTKLVSPQVFIYVLWGAGGYPTLINTTIGRNP